MQQPVAKLVATQVTGDQCMAAVLIYTRTGVGEDERFNVIILDVANQNSRFRFQPPCPALT